jgi:hypothetical protein
MPRGMPAAQMLLGSRDAPILPLQFRFDTILNPVRVLQLVLLNLNATRAVHGIHMQHLGEPAASIRSVGIRDDNAMPGRSPMKRPTTAAQ